MKREGERYLIFDLEGDNVGELRIEGGHEVWPEEVNGWKHVLDCTVEPYEARTLLENINYARYVNKPNVLLTRAQFEREEPAVRAQAGG